MCVFIPITKLFAWGGTGWGGTGGGQGQCCFFPFFFEFAPPLGLCGATSRRCAPCCSGVRVRVRAGWPRVRWQRAVQARAAVGALKSSWSWSISWAREYRVCRSSLRLSACLALPGAIENTCYRQKSHSTVTLPPGAPRLLHAGSPRQRSRAGDIVSEIL